MNGGEKFYRTINRVTNHNKELLHCLLKSNTVNDHTGSLKKKVGQLDSSSSEEGEETVVTTYV